MLIFDNNLFSEVRSGSFRGRMNHLKKQMKNRCTHSPSFPDYADVPTTIPYQATTVLPQPCDTFPVNTPGME